MSERIKSAWRITWDPSGTPLVLLDYGDLMLAEPTFPQQHAIQSQPFLRSDFISTWDRGNVSFEMEVSRISAFTTPAALRSYALSQSVTVAALRHATLKIEVEGGDVYELRNSSISASAPNLSKELVLSGLLAFSYRVTGGELVKIP